MSFPVASRDLSRLIFQIGRASIEIKASTGILR